MMHNKARRGGLWPPAVYRPQCIRRGRPQAAPTDTSAASMSQTQFPGTPINRAVHFVDLLIYSTENRFVRQACVPVTFTLRFAGNSIIL